MERGGRISALLSCDGMPRFTILPTDRKKGRNGETRPSTQLEPAHSLALACMPTLLWMEIHRGQTFGINIRVGWGKVIAKFALTMLYPLKFDHSAARHSLTTHTNRGLPPIKGKKRHCEKDDGETASSGRRTESRFPLSNFESSSSSSDA